jgi:type II secretory pathway pseudopilin PulG
MSAHASAQRTGATLIEVLAVVTIIGISLSMVVSFTGRSARRSMQVRIEAEQLASVLRQTQTMAMDRKATFGVAFNIANARGSSGRVLNNRDGGHWYRVIGPSRSNGQQERISSGYGGYSSVFRFNRDFNRDTQRDLRSYDAPLGATLDEIANDWVGPKQVLPKGAVRFLALADQDNGSHRFPSWTFGATYPRPWFGSWEAATHRLRAWGGYDTDSAFLEFSQPAETWSTDLWRRQGHDGTINYSGFYYEGQDGRISGCVNPRDRSVYEDINGDAMIDLTDRKTRLLQRSGEPRPLVNADWLDAVVLFFPDGTAKYDDWFHLRHEYERYSRRTDLLFNEDGKHNLTDLAMGDMCNAINSLELPATPPNDRYEVSHFTERTGYWYVTLAPDVGNDNDTFATAHAAMETMMPMWRVGISRLGEVKLVEVKRVPPAGASLDRIHADTWWQTPGVGNAGYWNNLLTTPAGPAMPVEDFLTPEMLEHREWWLSP